MLKGARSSGIPVTNPESQEPPNAVAGTVAWLLSAMATLFALLAAVIVRVIYLRNADERTRSGVYLFLFAALVTGCVALVLTPLVHRIRKNPPPRNVTIGVVTIGLVPIIIQVCLIWFR